MKISVVMCTYNGERFLWEQLTSVANQTRVPDEIIVFDDNSSDSTLAIVSAACAKYSLNCQIHKNPTTQGFEKNFSLAMDESKGDVIFFCDQDDVWLPYKVEKMTLPFLKNKMVSLVYSDAYIAGPDLTKSGHTLFGVRKTKDHCYDLDSICARLRKGLEMRMRGCAMAFSSRFKEIAGQVPEGISHDKWIGLFACAFGEAITIEEPLFYYRRHDFTISSSTNKLIPGLIRRNKKTKTYRFEKRALFVQQVKSRLKYLENEGGDFVMDKERIGVLKSAAEEGERILVRRARINDKFMKLTRIVKVLSHYATSLYR
ncbi:MAG TPA: glycosyltransferase family 2 protein [Syntrophales bacterium]|nr:glycosyltransferase family 2 protein [Syntrophales bacterium]